MDTELITSTEKEGFIKYVFDLSDDNKNNIINMIQYALIAIIPIVIILKAIKHFVPEEDETKGSLEIIVETVGQIVFIVGSIWFLDRIIRYLPTYTGVKYSEMNPISFVIPLLLILSTMQTKFGAKINILVDRGVDVWNGNTSTKEQMPATNVRVSQPISGQHQNSQADNLDMNQLLPSNRQLTSMPQQQPQSATPQESPDFNQMYQNTVNPLEAAATPGIVQEPMAANDGQSPFGGW
tara:strand:- start:1944 stop:2657 length:714 start_codon:yes stop_codon:yes gene_type:complete